MLCVHGVLTRAMQVVCKLCAREFEVTGLSLMQHTTQHRQELVRHFTATTNRVRACHQLLFLPPITHGQALEARVLYHTLWQQVQQVQQASLQREATLPQAQLTSAPGSLAPFPCRAPAASSSSSLTA